MSLPDGQTPLKRIRNHYRLVVINEDSFEEVAAFKLTRWSVYITVSALFILLVGLTIGLIAFTPLKYYIPGYGTTGKAREYQSLKLKADSIEQALILKQAYIRNIEKVLKGNVISPDTSVLKVTQAEKNRVEKRIPRGRKKRN
jgi:hypothetical protein